MKKLITHAAYLAVILALFLMNRCQSGEIDKLSLQNNAFQTELTLSIDDNGTLTAQVADMRITRQRDLKNLHASTIEQERLKQMADKYKRMYSGIAISTRIHTKGIDTTIVMQMDTVMVGDTIQLWPVYTSEINQEYRTGHIEASKDSIQYDIKERVPLDFAQRMEGGFLKRKTAVLTVTSKNPAVEITGLASYSLKEPKRRLAFGPQVGYGITPSGNFQLYFGAGLTYRIL